WGLPGQALWATRGQMVRVPLDFLAGVVSLFFTILLAYGALQASRRSAGTAARVVFSMLCAGLLLAGVMLAASNGRAAGKSVTYVSSLLIFGLVSASTSLP